MKSKRIFNNRPLCFVALFIAMGLIIGEVLYPFNKLFRLIPTVLSLLTAIGLFSFSKTRKFGYIALSFLVGILAICGANDIYDSRRIDSVNTQIQATVDSEIIVDDGKTIFYVKDIIVDGDNLQGRAYVSLSGDDIPDYRAGDVVVVSGNFEFREHEQFDTYYSVAVNKSCYYNMWGRSAHKVADGSPSFPLNLQLNIKEMFYYNLDGDSAMICQALILGDKFGIDDALYDGIKASGLAHVLAVSGLHVTALASALLLLLKKTRLKPIISFAIVSVMTFLYVLLCGFTASSIRAFIMTAVLNFGTCMGYKYDKLSSLSLSAIILMIVRPQSIMDVGFLLSMFSVLGIFTYYSTFKQWTTLPISKLNLGKRNKADGKFLYYCDRTAKTTLTKMAESTSISLSANMMTLPLVGHFFNSVPILFVLSNIVILPYMMFIYLFLLFITVFCQITTLWSSVTVMQYLLLPLHKWTQWIGGIPWSNIHVSVSVTLIVAWIVSSLISSKYIFTSTKTKIVSVCLWLAVFALSVVLCFV